MKNYLYRFFFLIIFTFITISTSFAASKYGSVEEMLAKQKTIRILIDNAPGYGNQSASLNLMSRLRQMNFQGTFEVIYPDTDDGFNSDMNIRIKMINLFNLPNDLPSVYTIEDSQHRKITFIADSEYIKQFNDHQIKPLPLALTGAHDSTNDNQCMLDNTCRQHGEGLADFMNTDVFLDLQPWFETPDFDTYYVRGSINEHTVDPYGKFLVFPVATFADAKEYLQIDVNGQALLAQKPALKTLMARMENKTVNVFPIYGYTFRKAYNNENEEYSELVYPQNILEVIAAARYVQLNGPSNLRRPLIIAVFYNYREEIDEISHLLTQSDWKTYEKQGGKEIRAAIAALGLARPNILQTADVSDTDASTKIENLQPGQILLLSVGSLPKLVFDGLYAHTDTNIWPQIREGQSSLNVLALTGKPHFRCIAFKRDDASRWEFGFDYINDPVLKSQLTEFYGDKAGFCQTYIWKKNPLHYQSLARLIIDANDPSSSFSRSFVDLRAEALKPENDRIYRGLQAALKALNATATAAFHK